MKMNKLVNIKQQQQPLQQQQQQQQPLQNDFYISLERLLYNR